MLVSLRARSESWSLDPRIYPRVILGLIIPGLGLSTALLALFGYATWNVGSRRYLDRVSFRLLTHALVAHLVFGVSFAMSSLAGYQDWRCSLLSFLTGLSLMFSLCIFFCMALNVPLVVVYKISGQAMEKYYLAGTALVSLICMVPPYASGNLGHVPIPTKTCWFNGADPAARFRGVFGTQISWIIMAVGEIGAFLIIVGYLFTHELHLLWRPAHAYSEGPGSTILKFRNIILRVGLYPLTSCLLSITTVGINLYESRKHKMEGIQMTKLDTILTLVSITNTAGRPLIYGLLAATDPSLIRALQALRHPDTETETQLCRRSGCLSTIVEILPETSFDDGEALDNDHVPQECMRGRESSAAPNSDLEVGKKWRFYFGHSTSLSMCKPASNSPAVDVVSHI
ncbi:hypothetical protein B0H14DRAFT_3755457 [Mycena olivaceomarginata]|nr:hypothetical protein B0H14DRAFT_3755457 [Mycena olivaceomarginata]